MYNALFMDILHRKYINPDRKKSSFIVNIECNNLKFNNTNLNIKIRKNSINDFLSSKYNIKDLCDTV